MDFIDINIVIAPPEYIAAKTRKLSRSLKRQGSQFVLGKTDFFPHISIYMLRLPISNIDRVIKMVNVIGSELEPFPITAYRFRNVKNGFIDIRYFRNMHIKGLQRKILEYVNPLRSGALRENDLKRLHEYSIKAKRLLERYGYRNVEDNFAPHLSLTRLTNQLSLPQINSELKWDDFSFTVNKLGIYLCGEHGTCRKLIKAVNF